MAVQEIHGTVNIIVLIRIADPTDSCMVASVITATEAKSAALRDLTSEDLYTGDSATGSITDSVAVASTCTGKIINYGGPARLGDPVTGIVTLHDRGVRRWIRGFFADKWYFNVLHILYVMGALTVSGLGAYASISQLISAFENPQIDAFTCQSPLNLNAL